MGAEQMPMRWPSGALTIQYAGPKLLATMGAPLLYRPDRA